MNSRCVICGEYVLCTELADHLAKHGEDSIELQDASIHTYPEGEAGHSTDSDWACPCLPMVEHTDSGTLIRHNAYDGRECGEVFGRAIDMMGLALAEHGHQWTAAERDAYEHAHHLLVMHWPKSVHDTPPEKRK